ncbi:hypothetical protein H4R18_000246 [Coemansia javaensis]|uniref:SHSP domain-containing protein n=1 Tax=Coemansia javaensis TaxID=2761396 RepID=A0A9W8LKU6_9FUNG|nr:hypothetical protein H4R18_000246 [Coemansia javaensis]
MGRGRSNFQQDIFPEHPGFRTVHAGTLPGRELDVREWAGWTWPRFGMPLLGGAAEHGAGALARQQAARPTILGQQLFVPPPPMEDAARITRRADGWEFRLESPAFVGSETRVRVKGGRLLVSARSARVGVPPAAAGAEANAFEYARTLPPGFVASRVSARRTGQVLVVTVPIAAA